MGAMQSFLECVERERDLPSHPTSKAVDPQPWTKMPAMEESINTEMVKLYKQCGRQKGNFIETRKELLDLVAVLKKWGYHFQRADEWVIAKIRAAQAARGHLHLSHVEFRDWFRGQVIADEINEKLLFQRNSHAEITKTFSTSERSPAGKSTIEATPKAVDASETTFFPQQDASCSAPKSILPVVVDNIVADKPSSAHIRAPRRRPHDAMRRSG